MIACAARTGYAEDRSAYTKHDWPVQVINRPLTLAPEMAEVSGDTFVITLSKDKILDPLALAPDIRSGLSRRLTLAVIHDLGFCLNDTGCGTVYNDVGLEAMASVVHSGAAQMAVRVGIQFPRFSRLFSGARFGLTMRLRTWRLALLAEPTLYVGIYGRGEDPDFSSADARGRAEIIDVPITLQLQLTSRGLLFVLSGVQGPASGFSDEYTAPLGIGGTFAINHRVDLGTELRFANPFGADGTISRGLDDRTLFLRAALRL